MSFSILPRVVWRTESQVNGEIVVKEHLGKYGLYVQGLIQSGGVVGEIWRKALALVGRWQPTVKRILVLGLGGGTVVQLIKQRWPEAKIVGVEIDPVIVNIGKKYFGLTEVAGLEIVEADAFEWVEKPTNLFDLLIVDLYLGKEFPKKATSGQFLKCLTRLLKSGGILVFNRLKKDTGKETFEHALGKYFPKVATVKTAANLFFLARS